MQKEITNKGFNTLVDVINYYTARGYNYTFLFGDSNSPKPEEWCIAGFYRFEGKTNPSDSSIAYLLHKTDNSARGILVNAYSIYSSSKIEDFINKVLKCAGQNL